MSEDFKTALKQADLLFAIVLVGLVFAVIIGFSIAGCNDLQRTEPAQAAQQPLPDGIDVVTVDSCQYLTWQYGPFNAPAVAMVHKANCSNHGGKP